MDEQGFREMVDTFSRQVFALAYRVVGNEYDAEEVVQDTFLKAWRNRKSFEGRSSVKTWLFSIATHTALDHIRKRGRQPQTEAEPMDQVTDLNPGQDKQLLTAETHRRVLGLVQGLAPKERAAFVLRHCEGYTMQEISEITGLNVGSAKQAVFRAVHKLRQALTVRTS